MGRNERRNRARGKNWNESRTRGEARRFSHTENAENSAENESAIREFKARENVCPACGKSISDISEAIADKATGLPMHFDCVLEKLRASENPHGGQQVTYIGQGRFAVISYANARDTKHFKIEKIIEWEDRNASISWRSEMADLYSKIK